jgi:two-component system chemotaxis sensor kinase CheA
LEDGEVCLILNPTDLIHSAKKQGASQPEPQEDLTTGKCILIVEDSITVRTQLKRILQGAGYRVTVAVDGLEAWKQMEGQRFDAVVSDIQMPNMTGLELAEKIRSENKYVEMPIILVSSLASAADRKRGMEAGANAYIAKPSFDQKLLLDTLRRLV